MRSAVPQGSSSASSADARRIFTGPRSSAPGVSGSRRERPWTPSHGRTLRVTTTPRALLPGGPAAAQRPARARRCCPSGWRCRSSAPTRCRSVAYATEEILLVLGLGGLALLHLTPWVAAAVVRPAGGRRRLLPADLPRLSQRRRRLRRQPRRTSASAPPGRRERAAGGLRPDRRRVGRRRGGRDHVARSRRWCRTRSCCRVAFVALLTVVNLRGVKESGRAFAVPTYGFVAIVLLMLVVGVVRVADRPPADGGERRATASGRAPHRRAAHGASSRCGRSPPAAPR